MIVKILIFFKRVVVFSFTFPRRFLRRLFIRNLALKIVNYAIATREPGNIIIFGVPEHGNIGDHAIVLAEREFFKKYFSKKNIIDIADYAFPTAEKVFRELSGNAILTVVGGGNLGNLWISAEKAYRKILATFPNDRIVIFPQTIFFEQNDTTEKEINKTRNAYRSHPDLHIFIRDNSIDFLRKEIVEKNIYSVPDIVLSLDRSAPKFERKGVLLCFRADKEKVVPAEMLAAIEENLRSRGESCSRTDMVVPYGVPAFAREIEVEKKFDEFRRSRLVITDRLHGMIFATITGTPCIAVNNISKKVQGVWGLWIRERFPYVKFVENADEIPALLDEMLALGPQRYDPSVFGTYWQQLANVVRGGVKE